MNLRVGIAGLGLIGGSLLRGLAAAGCDVAGYDTDDEVMKAAEGGGFALAGSVDELAGRSDAVFVAVPPRVAADVVAAALRASAETVVADATSFKKQIVDGVATAAPGALDRFVPAHPLAGAERAGFGASHAGLLQGAVWAICPPSDAAPAGPLCTIGAVLDQLDSRLVVCTADDHDDAVARTSHVPHVAAQALVHLVGEGDAPLRAVLSGRGYRDTTRVAESDPQLWADILAANGIAAVPALGALIEVLQELRQAVEDGDRDKVVRAWATGRELRREVERLRWAEPAWTAEGADWPAWDRLFELGRAGRAVRRVGITGGRLEYEVSG